MYYYKTYYDYNSTKCQMVQSYVHTMSPGGGGGVLGIYIGGGVPWHTKKRGS